MKTEYRWWLGRDDLVVLVNLDTATPGADRAQAGRLESTAESYAVVASDY